MAARVTAFPSSPSVLLAALGVGVIGLVLEHFVIRHFYDRPFETLLLTWGFFLIATEMIKIVFGTDFRNVTNPFAGAFDLGIYRVPAYQTAGRRASRSCIIVAPPSSSSRPARHQDPGADPEPRGREPARPQHRRTYKLVFAFGALHGRASPARLITPDV